LPEQIVASLPCGTRSYKKAGHCARW
jgi:hypothetical protein